MPFLSRLATQFYRNSWVGVFIILLVLCSNFRYSFINTDPGGDSTLLSLPETFGWGFFIPLLIAFVPDRYRVLRRCLIGFFLFLASLLFFGEQILISGYKTIFTDSIALNILATNPREAAEFMAGASLVKYLFLPLLLFIASLAIAYVVYRLSRTKKGEISAYWLAAPLVVVLGAGFYSSDLIITSYRDNYPNYKVMTPITRLATGVMKCAEEMSSVEETLEALRRVDCGEVHQDPSFSAHSLVLVVGESATRAYHHCYGFPLANTPFLDSLIASKEVILFDNAVKYTEEDGVIKFIVWSKDRSLYLRVSDNGPGINNEDKKKIFDRFYRVDKARTRQKGGFGLGLSLAKQIADALKGTITVKDNRPKGTIFEVKISIKSESKKRVGRLSDVKKD